MFVYHSGVIADHEQSADGETADAAALRDAGFLQEGQTAAATADEDEFGFVNVGLTAGILHFDSPSAVFGAVEILDRVVIMDVHADCAR